MPLDIMKESERGFNDCLAKMIMMLGPKLLPPDDMIKGIYLQGFLDASSLLVKQASKDLKEISELFDKAQNNV